MCMGGSGNPDKPSDKKSVGSASVPCPGNLPNDVDSAPNEVRLPSSVDKDFKQQYSDSFPNGKSQEHGGTLVKDSQGGLKLVNKGAGESGAFMPDRKVDADETIVGTMHTHPYDKSEGGYKGVSFSGADVAYAYYYKEPIYVDAGNKQFMIMPTDATPKNLPWQDLDDEWNDSFKQQRQSGKSMQDASSAATKAMARKYDMAYYEGKDGKLKRQ
ncbi:MAG: hypothetical protein KF778_05985 [Rhodocyclaceae bacterium]|nr:hypothetical protein [Rhodocyclaceae bacterium]MBX3667935.1 hypothetical protein [Rhodocyclaceae bacterium]